MAEDSNDENVATQFSIRRMMVWTAVLGLLFAIAAMAVRGSSFALAFSWTVFLLVASVLTYAIMFILASGVAGGFRALLTNKFDERSDEESPFAEHRPPPMMIRPEEPN